jgi:non-heme chloroperoxidase
VGCTGAATFNGDSGISGCPVGSLINEAHQLIVEDDPHCITWTHAEEVNAELLSFLGEKAGKSQKVA